ncbi:NAD+ synthetase [Candidatus Phytoplasma asteris]|uniref:Glutamine-dependent NAD(+) synthetase n=2 Tax=16SrI (Aster yellows group) TaxID=3042590 RepID=A0A859I917_9MOLU|nr:MAG: NAD+ synthetase [Rapeseed phyllody phytoplasma]
MYKNGSIKIELASPPLTVGNPLKNAYSMQNVLNKSKASFVLFPELCLSSYTAGDLFFETTFLEQNFQALDWLLKNNSFEGVYILGMPLALHEVLFNVAVIIQKDKILGITPKKTIPNYKEFSEKRWFQSGKTCESQYIQILGQTVPFGDVLFINSQFDLIFGVEICQDLWTVFSPGDLLSLNGAHLIFNPSASTDHIGKLDLRKNAVLDHSRKQIGGYFYTSSGITESTVDNLFSNHKMAALLGEMVAEKDLFNQDVSLVVDVCVDLIKFQRRIDTTYGDQRIGKQHPFLKAYFELQETPHYQFEKPINQTPFIPQSNVASHLKLANEIQVLALKTKLSNLNAKIIVEITENINDLLTLVVAFQSFSLLQKPLEDFIVILNPLLFSNQTHYQLLKYFLQTKGVCHICESSFLKKKDLLAFLGLDKTDATTNTTNLTDATNDTSATNEINEANETATLFNDINNISTLSNELASCSKDLDQVFLKELASQTQKFLLLENNNFSDMALGKNNPRSHYDHIYNVNAGVPNVLVKELLLYHLEKNYLQIAPALKKLYQKLVQENINQKLIMEDFILCCHIKKGFTKTKIAWLLQIAFDLSPEKSNQLVVSYLKTFYQNQFKRQNMAPGPKVLENSLSPRNEFLLPIYLQRQE